MPIKLLETQQRFRQLGAIRMGKQVPTSNPKFNRPEKLQHWRLTSPSGELLAHAAEAYGGDVRPWDGAPAGAPQYELYTEADTLDVAIPPLAPGAPIDTVFSQWFEQWSGGGCLKRCDGEENVLDGTPCTCPTGDVDAMRLGRDPKEIKAGRGTCAMTTRLSLLLYRVPDLGVWKMESHGYYAAVELAPAVNALNIAQQTGRPQPARIRIEQRQKVANGQTSNFVVPVLELPTLTTGVALGMIRGHAPLEVESRAVAIAPPKTVDLQAAAREVPVDAVLVEANRVLDRIKVLGEEQRGYAKSFAAGAGARCTPTSLRDNPQVLADLSSWLDLGATVPTVAVAAGDPERPF